MCNCFQVRFGRVYGRVEMKSRVEVKYFTSLRPRLCIYNPTVVSYYVTHYYWFSLFLMYGMLFVSLLLQIFIRGGKYRV